MVTRDSVTTQQINEKYTKWKKQDCLIMSWLLGSMSEDIIVDLLHSKTAKEIWINLQQMFTSRNLAKVMEIRTKLQNIKKGNLSLRDYMRKIKNLIDSLKVRGKIITTEDHVLHILSELGPKYEYTVSVITAKSGAISLQEITSLLLSHESRMEKDVKIVTTKDTTLPSVNLAHQHNTHQPNNEYQRHHHPQSYDNTNRGRGRHNRGGGKTWYPRNRVQCQICHKFGHTADRCYFKVPNNPNLEGNFSNRQQFSQPQHPITPNSMFAMLIASDLNKDTNWYLDSGATNHITNDMNNLTVSNER